MEDDEIKIDKAKVEALTKKFDEEYGETVLTLDNCKSHEEREAILKHNEHAKDRHATRRENERIQASIERDEKIKANFKKATNNIKKGVNSFVRAFQRFFGAKQK